MKKLTLFCFLLMATFAFSKGAGSYSSGSRSSFSGSRSSFSSSSRPLSSGRTYSSGNKSSSPSSSLNKNISSAGMSKADKAQAKMESKASFSKYKADQIQAKYKTAPQSYDYLRNQPKEVYSSRPARQEVVFHTYYSRPPVVYHYHDTGWNPFFWMWLMDHQDRQAEWTYHHRSELSDERYRDLVSKNKDLENQIKALEDKKVPKDPNFSPKEIDKDLMYSDEMAKDAQTDDDDDYTWLWWIVLTPIVVLGVGYTSYAIFFKKREW